MEGKNVIVILQRSWVWVGTIRTDPDNGLFYILENSATVRRWGTTNGLEELADKGPRSETILDKGSTPKRFPLVALVGILECNMEQKGWQKWFQSK